MSLAHRLAPLALLLAACSNGTGPETNPDTTTTADPCAALASSCVAKQEGCVTDGAEARCEPCKAGEYASLAGACTPLSGTPLTHEFNEFTTKPGEEILGLCQSWTLNNAEEIWVNAVELTQNEASHHSNWTYVPDDQYPGPDGVWPCQDRDYHQLNAALFGGVLYAQSTQATHEVQKFPEGAAIRIPPYSRVIGDVHLLNTGDGDVTGSVKISMYALPVDEVKIKLVPFHLTYDGLNIPPHATSRFTGNCAVGDEFPAKLLAMKVHYILPHTHAMASGFFVDILGGPDDGKRLIELKGFTSEAHGLAFDPPIDMSQAKGFSFGCEYVNTRAEAVGWGFGDQEMCELLGFAESQRAFESRVDTADAAGNEGEIQLFTGDCGTIAYPWDHNKPGGPGPM